MDEEIYGAVDNSFVCVPIVTQYYELQDKSEGTYEEV